MRRCERCVEQNSGAGPVSQNHSPVPRRPLRCKSHYPNTRDQTSNRSRPDGPSPRSLIPPSQSTRELLRIPPPVADKPQTPPLGRTARAPRARPTKLRPHLRGMIRDVKRAASHLLIVDQVVNSGCVGGSKLTQHQPFSFQVVRKTLTLIHDSYFLRSIFQRFTLIQQF